MNTTDKLSKLSSLCKAGVYLELNGYVLLFQSASEWISNMRSLGFEVDDEVQEKAEEGTLVYLQFYPDTPIGFHYVIHYDLDVALDQALAHFP